MGTQTLAFFVPGWCWAGRKQPREGTHSTGDQRGADERSPKPTMSTAFPIKGQRANTLGSAGTPFLSPLCSSAWRGDGRCRPPTDAGAALGSSSLEKEDRAGCGQALDPAVCWKPAGGPRTVSFVRALGSESVPYRSCWRPGTGGRAGTGRLCCAPARLPEPWTTRGDQGPTQLPCQPSMPSRPPPCPAEPGGTPKGREAGTGGQIARKRRRVPGRDEPVTHS